MHRTVMSAYPEKLPENERVLFRLDIEPTTGVPVLLVQSKTAPDWKMLEGNKSGGYLQEGLKDNPGVKQFDWHLSSGEVFQYRLKANPTIRKDKQRIGLIREDEQKAWLERKAPQNGFELLDCVLSRREKINGSLYRDGQRHELCFVSIEFNGILKVNDPEKIIAVLCNGFGSGKGLGFGLMTLIRCRG